MPVAEAIELSGAAGLARARRDVEQVVAIALLRRARPHQEPPLVAPGVVRHHSVVKEQAQSGAVGIRDVKARELAVRTEPAVHEHEARARRRIDGVIDLVLGAAHVRARLQRGELCKRHDEPGGARVEVDPPQAVALRRLLRRKVADLDVVTVLRADSREPPVVERKGLAPARVQCLYRPGMPPLGAVGRHDPADELAVGGVVEDRALRAFMAYPLGHRALLEVPGRRLAEHLYGSRTPPRARRWRSGPRRARASGGTGSGVRRRSRAGGRSSRRSIPRRLRPVRVTRRLRPPARPLRRDAAAALRAARRARGS